MDAIAFARGKREWNGRFTGQFDRLCVESRPAALSDRIAHTTVLKAVLALSEALEDGDISAEEVRDNRAVLEAGRDAIDGLLRKMVRAA
jgi:hypothetical protein